MQTNTNDDQIKAIIAALGKLHMQPFRSQSNNPKRDAQKNLDGKTFYVSDDTLRWHKSRVLSCAHLFDGLLLRIICSDSMDPDNRQRGFRAVVFDVFGTVIYRPKLEDSYGTKRAAFKASDKETIDLVAHYRERLEREITQHENSISDIRAGVALLP